MIEVGGGLKCSLDIYSGLVTSEILALGEYLNF